LKEFLSKALKLVLKTDILNEGDIQK